MADPAGATGRPPGPGGPLAIPPSAADLWKQAHSATREGRPIALAAKQAAHDLATARSQLRANVRLLQTTARSIDSALASASASLQAPAAVLDPSGSIRKGLSAEYTGMLTVHSSLTQVDRDLRSVGIRVSRLRLALKALRAEVTSGSRRGAEDAGSLAALAHRLRPWLRWSATEKRYVARLGQEAALSWGEFGAVRRTLELMWQRLPSSLQGGLAPHLPAGDSSSGASSVTVGHPGSGCVRSFHSGIRMSDVDIASYAASAGFRNFDLTVAVAIALAESGGDPRAVCVDTNGSRDEGLWQINTVHGYPSSCTFEPGCSAAVAYRLYLGRGRAFGDWVTYSSDRFLMYLPRATRAAAAVSSTR
jgi:hypothetical protein